MNRTACITFANHGVGFTYDSRTTNPAGFRFMARSLLDYSAGALRCAVERGDNDGDPEGTLENAIAGCEFLAQFAQEFFAAADAFEEAESKAGGDV